MELSNYNQFRRNQRGDHEKALKTVEDIIGHAGDKATLSPDIICLAGRIYKDKFIKSNYEDRESLNKAIQWWVPMHMLHIYLGQNLHISRKKQAGNNF